MIRIARNFRLIPIVVLATLSLFALKVSGLVFDGGYTLGERLAGANRTAMTATTRESIPQVTPIIMADQQPAAKQSWAREMFNFGDVTGSVGASKPEDPPLKVTPKPAEPPKDAGGTVVLPDPGGLAPAGERAILGRLQDRRQELDARDRELEMRESLLKAAEKRLEAQVTELKNVETRINTAVSSRDKTEQQRFKDIVTMYENMKAKDAARIFDRLDLKILVEVATQINPRKMSEILALMSAEAAERLTVELANRASANKGPSSDKLPKIEGTPNGS
jgi:flagellar motility protein MotE (MotC chaperone)